MNQTQSFHNNNTNNNLNNNNNEMNNNPPQPNFNQRMPMYPFPIYMYPQNMQGIKNMPIDNKNPNQMYYVLMPYMPFDPNAAATMDKNQMGNVNPGYFMPPQNYGMDNQQEYPYNPYMYNYMNMKK